MTSIVSLNATEVNERRWNVLNNFPRESEFYADAKIVYNRAFQQDFKRAEKKHINILSDIRLAIIEVLANGQEATRLTLWNKIVQNINIKGRYIKIPKGCVQSKVGRWRFYWHHCDSTKTVTFYRMIYRGDIKSNRHK